MNNTIHVNKTVLFRCAKSLVKSESKGRGGDKSPKNDGVFTEEKQTLWREVEKEGKNKHVNKKTGRNIAVKKNGEVRLKVQNRNKN